MDKTCLSLFGLLLLAALCASQEVKCPAVDPMNSTVFLPYPQDCTKFYMCHNGQNTTMNCPWGTYFNANKSICDWPSNSGCVQPNPPSVCNPADLVPLYPVPNNCSAFITCVGQKQYEMACPKGLYFSPSLKVCVWPQQSGCVQPTQEPSTEAPSDVKLNQKYSSVPLPPSDFQVPPTEEHLADSMWRNVFLK